MYKKTLLITCTAIVLFFGLDVKSTLASDRIDESWIGFITAIDLNERWGIWNDFHVVPDLFFIHRHGLNYQATKNLRVSGGYAHLYARTSGNASFERNEHRPWFQFQLNKPLNTTYSLNFRFRHDMRFREIVSDGFATEEWLFTHRSRFQVNLRKKLDNFMGSMNFHLNARNEFHYNFGGDLPNGMDQNRTAFLLGHSKGKRTILSGYMLRSFTNQPANHAFVLWVVQRF